MELGIIAMILAATSSVHQTQTVQVLTSYSIYEADKWTHKYILNFDYFIIYQSITITFS